MKKGPLCPGAKLVNFLKRIEFHFSDIIELGIIVELSENGTLNKKTRNIFKENLHIK